MNTGTTAQTRKMEEQKKQEKLAKKALMKAKKAEQEALFGEALMAVSKKGGDKFNSKSGKVEAKGRDHDDGKEKGGTSRAMKMMFQMDAKEMEERLKEDVSYTCFVYICFAHTALSDSLTMLQSLHSPTMSPP